jgi:hypothetical protein
MSESIFDACGLLEYRVSDGVGRLSLELRPERELRDAPTSEWANEMMCNLDTMAIHARFTLRSSGAWLKGIDVECQIDDWLNAERFEAICMDFFDRGGVLVAEYPVR